MKTFNNTTLLRLIIIMMLTVSNLTFTAQENIKNVDPPVIMFAYTSNIFRNFGIGVDKPFKGNFDILESPFNTYVEFTTGFLKEKHFSERYKRIDLPDSIHKRFDYNTDFH